RHGRRAWNCRVPRANQVELGTTRSEEHTSELQSRSDLVCRLLLEKKKKDFNTPTYPQEFPFQTLTTHWVADLLGDRDMMEGLWNSFIIGLGVLCLFFFFFNDTATTEIYTLSLHDALPI